jgi:OST-HTH/LOTUS domain
MTADESMGGDLPEATVSAEDSVVAAFLRARQAGKRDWRRMSLAVLKNRMLDVTAREFDERKLGYTTFREFVSAYPEIVRMDTRTHPPTVELLAEVPSGPTEPELDAVARDQPRASVKRIRPDFWRAVLDQSGRFIYEWDGTRVVPHDPQDTPDLIGPVIPIIDADTLTGWRTAYVSRVLEEDPTSPYGDVLGHWRDERLSSSVLPPRLRAAWYAELKDRVHGWIQGWFERSGVPPPSDLLLSATPPSRRNTGTESLRALVVDCVQAMTRVELEELRLPPAALLRIRR